MGKQGFVVLLSLCLALAGCSTKAPAASRPGSVLAPGPGLGHVPVPKEQGNWAASAATPARTAALFVLGPSERCECREVSTALVSGGPTVNLVRVRLEGMMDDSIRNMEYLVVVRRNGEVWKVVSATYLTECRRSVGEDGLCV